MIGKENIEMVNNSIEAIKNIEWTIKNIKLSEVGKDVLLKFQQEIYKEMIDRLSFCYKR